MPFRVILWLLFLLSSCQSMLAGPLPRENTAQEPTFSWTQIDQRIRWHRECVRLCGPLAAARALRLAGHSLAWQTFVDQFSLDHAEGVPLLDVLRVCQRYEPSCSASRVARTELKKLARPCILVVNEGRHCVVLQSIDQQSALAEIWDPSEQREKQIPLDHLQVLWNGHVIQLRGPGDVAPWIWWGNVLAIVGWTFLAGYYWNRRKGSPR
jgi:hypothetical protein